MVTVVANGNCPGKKIAKFKFLQFWQSGMGQFELPYYNLEVKHLLRRGSIKKSWGS